MICVFPFNVYAQKYQVATLAGFPHDADGVKEEASFNEPEGIAIDKRGNLYIADTWNHKVRKITPDGIVSTLVGSKYGSAYNIIPTGIAVDNNGNVYISSRHQIYRITTDGNIIEFAGSSEDGDTDGFNAHFYNIKGLACDNYGNIFVVDGSNDKIKKITPDGFVSSYAGYKNNSYADSLLYFPNNVAIDKHGNLFVSDGGNNCIRKITAQGSISTFAGSAAYGSEDGIGSSAGFIRPCGITIDLNGNLFVVDQGNNAIRKITKEGEVTTIPIAFTNKIPSFKKLSSITIDSSGYLYVTDIESNLIYKISQKGELYLFAGCGLNSIDGIGSKAFFNYPVGMVMDKKGNIFISDKNNHNIRKIDPAGNVKTFAGSGNKGCDDGKGLDASFNEPHGLAIDKKGNIYVADKSNNSIRIINRKGEVETYLQNKNKNNIGANDYFSQPIDICIDSKGNLYVLNQYASQIQIIDTEQNVRLLSTNPSLEINNNSISIDNQDNLYIGSSNEMVVLKIDPTNALYKIEDSSNTKPLKLRYPNSIAIDEMGNIYVTSIYFSKIFIASPKGDIYLTIGNDSKGYRDGDIENAYFSNPTKILIDKKGNIFIIDTGNSLIRKVSLIEE